MLLDNRMQLNKTLNHIIRVGIGRVTERILNAVNVKTCKDIYEKLTYLYKLCYPCTFAFLIRVALGIGNENNHVYV